jgi:hypothetical protein
MLLFTDAPLREVAVPNSVRLIDRRAFAEVRKSVVFHLCSINFYVRGEVLKDAFGGPLTRDLGWSVSVVMAQSIEIDCDGSFRWNKMLESVAFGADWAMQRIGEEGLVTAQLKGIVAHGNYSQ